MHVNISIRWYGRCTHEQQMRLRVELRAVELRHGRPEWNYAEAGEVSNQGARET